MAQRGLGDGRTSMNAHRVEALSGAVATSTTVLARAMWIYALKMD
jgi:hypothetical protein